MESLQRLPSQSSMSKTSTQTAPPLLMYLLLPQLGFWQLAVLVGLSLLVKRRRLHRSCWNGVPGLLRYPDPSPGSLSLRGWRDAMVQHGINQLWSRRWWGQGGHHLVAGSSLPWLAARPTFWRRKATEGWWLRCLASCSPPCACWSWTGTLCRSSPTLPRAPGVRRAPSWPADTQILPTQEACSFGWHPPSSLFTLVHTEGTAFSSLFCLPSSLPTIPSRVLEDPGFALLPCLLLPPDCLCHRPAQGQLPHGLPALLVSLRGPHLAEGGLSPVTQGTCPTARGRSEEAGVAQGWRWLSHHIPEVTRRCHLPGLGRSHV